MSKQALLNVNLIAARKGAAELEFAVKKVHSLDSSKGGPDGYLKAIEKRVEDLVFDEIEKFHKEDNLLSIHRGHEINNSNVTWILKPIDGTENFLNGYPHFSISLCAKIDDEMYQQCIDPIRREEFLRSLVEVQILTTIKLDQVSSKALLMQCFHLKSQKIKIMTLENLIKNYQIKILI